MVFAANSAIVLNNKALIAKMAVEPRRTESAHFANWFRNQGFEVEELEKIVSHSNLVIKIPTTLRDKFMLDTTPVT